MGGKLGFKEVGEFFLSGDFLFVGVIHLMFGRDGQLEGNYCCDIDE
jgi:hypothetical protein